MSLQNLFWEGDGDGNAVDGCDHSVSLYLGIPNPGIHRLILVLEEAVLNGGFNGHSVTLCQLLMTGLVQQVRSSEADKGHLHISPAKRALAISTIGSEA